MNQLIEHRDILRTTERAVAIENPLYKEAAEAYEFGGVNELAKRTSYAAQQAYLKHQTLLWLPKSQVTITDGMVTHVAWWLAREKGLDTREAAAAWDAGVERHAALVAEAKAAGIKGVVSRMRTRTLEAKLAAHRRAAEGAQA